MHDRRALPVGNPRVANPSHPLLFSLLRLFLYRCNILSSPPPPPPASPQSSPPSRLMRWTWIAAKLPSLGHFGFTLRWILLSTRRGNIRSLGSHKRPRLFSFFPAVFGYGLKGGKTDAWQCRLFLTHVGNSVCRVLSHAGWTKATLKYLIHIQNIGGKSLDGEW